MNTEAQKKFDEKLATLHKRYQKLRWRARLIWLAFTVVLLIVLLIFVKNIATFATIFGICTLFSLSAMTFTLKNWREEEGEQERVLMDSAPVEKIRLYDDD